MAMIELSMIHSNPYRDFEMDPLDPDVVESMKRSIEDMEFWGGLAVRELDDDEGYELAFGHHRLEALRALGRTYEDLKVVNFDDDMMVKAMVAENALQRGGDTSAHLDAVQAICQRIIYKVLSVEGDAKKLATIVASYSTTTGEVTPITDMAAKKLIASVDKGEPISERLVLGFDDTLTRRSVIEALAALRDSSKFPAIHTVVRKQIQLEKEYEAAEAERLKLDKQERERRNKEAAEAKKATEQSAEDQKLVAGTSAAYDIKVSQVFDRDSHAKAFREVVTTTNGKKYIPLTEQVNMAAAIKQRIRDNGESVTGDRIKTYANLQIAEAAKFERKAQKKMEKEVASEEASRGWKAVIASITKLDKEVDKVFEAMKTCGNGFERKVDARTALTVSDKAVKKLEALLEKLDVDKNVISIQSKKGNK